MEEVNILANSCEKVWRPERTLLDSCVCSWARGCRSIWRIEEGTRALGSEITGAVGSLVWVQGSKL